MGKGLSDYVSELEEDMAKQKSLSIKLVVGQALLVIVCVFVFLKVLGQCD